MPLSLDNVSISKRAKTLSILKTQNLTPPFDPRSFEQTICHANFLSNNIIFKGNIKNLDDFEKTVEYNYFELPKVKLEDGSYFQIKPDKFQLECAKKLYQGDSVIFEASTGAGKTSVAHYAVNKNIYDDKKTIITVPLISLANDKYREFSRIYGEDTVGLLTGSNKINPDAPILIMVTEILRNQAQSIGEKADEIGTIVFDEAHYIGDSDRGAVWENSIINAVPKGIQTLYLSATLKNGKEFASWIKSLNPSQKVSRVEANVLERFVPLTYSVYRPNKDEKGEFVSVIDGDIDISSIDEDNLTDRQKRALEEIFKTQNNKSDFYEMSENEFIVTLKNLKIKLDAINNPKTYNPESFLEALKEAYPKLEIGQCNKIAQLLLSNKTVKEVHVPPLEANDFPSLVKDLKEDDKLPALIFKLSQKGADSVISDLNNEESGVDLTTDEEKEKIKEIINEYRQKGIYLGKDFDENSLLKGFASHHAGKMPGCRKLVEDLFSKKLIKVVSATSTLSAGINMPVRTVVMTDVTYKKYNPKTREMEFSPLGASEFHQMAGRAGRRGIDSIGHVVLYNLYSDENGFFDDSEAKGQVPKDKLKLAYKLIASEPDDLKSNFKPEPCMLAQYYENHSDNLGLKDEIAKSFRVNIAKDPQKEIKNLYRKFENYSTILSKNNFIEKNYKNEITLTPKGKMLEHCAGANPLMLSSLVYDKKLDCDVEQLCQIAGYIASSENQEEDTNLNAVVSNRFSTLMQDEEDKIQRVSSYEKMSSDYKDVEDKILKATLEARVSPADIVQSDNFGGFAAYMWAFYNAKNPDNPIKNFELLMDEALKPEVIDDKRDFTGSFRDSEIKAKVEFNRKAKEGSVYKVLSQSVSVLKQIEKAAEFALSDSENYPEKEYYEKLKDSAARAVELMKKPPVGDEIAV